MDERTDLTDAERLEVERLELFITEFEEKHRGELIRSLSQYERDLWKKSRLKLSYEFEDHRPIVRLMHGDKVLREFKFPGLH